MGAGGVGGWHGGRPQSVPVPSARLVSRELLSAHKDNLGTTIKFVVFNELSNARNPNNMQTLYTVLQHSSELAPKVGRLAAACTYTRTRPRVQGWPPAWDVGLQAREERTASPALPGVWTQRVVWYRAAWEKAWQGAGGPASYAWWRLTSGQVQSGCSPPRVSSSEATARLVQEEAALSPF